MSRNISAKNKLILSIAILFVIAIGVIGTVSFYNFKKASNSSYSHRLEVEAFLLSKAIEQRVTRYFEVLEVIQGELAIGVEGNVKEQKLTHVLAEIENKLDVVEAYIGLKNGDTYLVDGKISNFNAKDKGREWYRRAIAGEKRIITTPYKSTTGPVVMALAVPITREGQIIGVLAVNLSVNYMTEFIRGISEENQLFVAREDGFVLAAQKEEYIGKNLYKLRPMYAQYKNQHRAQVVYEYKGRDYFVVNSLIESLGWSVWSWDTIERINAASNENLTYTGGLAFFIIIITILTGNFLITRLMYQPIGGEPTDIQNMVNEVANGNLNLDTDAHSKNATGILKSTIEMITNLRTLIQGIDSAAGELSHSSSALSSSALQVRSGSEEQMLQLEQTSTAMNEMTVTVDEVARNALGASEAAEKANKESQNGLVVVQTMNMDIERLVNGAEEVVNVNERLETETQRIGSILEVISAISEQTNLLALNAAIEAARAGEYGRGFAVVADEVRNLANRTKDSTNEITEMITVLQGEAKRSVELMKINMGEARAVSERSVSATQSLDNIQHSIVAIVDMNNQIATAAEEQTHVANEINQSINTINELARTTYEQSNDTSDMTEKLNEVAHNMNISVDSFKR